MPRELAPLARRLSLQYYEESLPAHDCFHAKRVRDLSLRLAKESENDVDRDVLAAAAWLHDVGRPLEREGEIDHHDRWAAREVRDLLVAQGVSDARTDAIEHCIRAHSIRSTSPAPETPEAKFLFDADKLDATGAHGIVRLACIVGERSGRAGEAYATIDDATMPGADASDRPDVTHLQTWARERLDALQTEPARQLGASRWEFMEGFFAQLFGEIGPDADR